MHRRATSGKLAYLYAENSAEIGHGVPCWGPRRTRVVRHKLAVTMWPCTYVTTLPRETEIAQISQKRKKTKYTSTQNRVKRRNSETCALGFTWLGVIKEQTARVYFFHFLTACDRPPIPLVPPRPSPWIVFGRNFYCMRGGFIRSAETGAGKARFKQHGLAHLAV